MPTPPQLTPTPPSSSPHEDSTFLVPDLTATTLGDDERPFGAQGGVWPMSRPLLTPSLTSLIGHPSLTRDTEVAPVNKLFEPWTDDVIYSDQAHVAYDSDPDTSTSYEADDEVDLPSHRSVGRYSTATWDASPDVSFSRFIRGKAPSPSFGPKDSRNAVATWKAILGTSSPSFAEHNENSPDFADLTETDSDANPQSGTEEGSSRSCAFLFWSERWSVVHRLLKNELENSIKEPRPTTDTMCHAFADLVRDLGQLECHYAYQVSEIMDEMTILRIVLQSSKSNIAALSRLLSGRLDRLDSEIQATADVVRYSHDDDAVSDTDKWSATFISSHSGSVYLDI